MIYSTDASGKPTGFDAETAVVDRGQLWRTQAHPHWYGLGVLSGLPPESLQGTLLNAADFSVEIPLSDGENDFTLLGEPGPLSEVDAYQRFALNLFFDGLLDHPGISVLFPRRGSKYGNPPVPSQSDILLALSVSPVSATPETIYDDGSVKVSVSGISFGPPQSLLSVNLVSAQAPVPSPDGQPDWIGVLEIMVEGADSGAVRGPGPGGFGIHPGGDLNVSAEPDVGQPPAGGGEGLRGEKGGGPSHETPWHVGTRDDAEPTVNPEQSATPDTTPSPGAKTPAGSAPTLGPGGSQTPGPQTTRTSDAISHAETPTLAATNGAVARTVVTPTIHGAAVTPTAAALKAEKPKES